MSIPADEDEFYYQSLKGISQDALIEEIKHLREELSQRWKQERQDEWEKARALEANKRYDSKFRVVRGAIAIILFVVAYLLHSGAINIRWGILVTLIAAIGAATKAGNY